YMRLASFHCLAIALLCLSCEDGGEVSAAHAARHVEGLVSTVAADVAEIRAGLPQGADHVAELWKAETPPQQDLPAVRSALLRAREKVQDLRIAKSTFFAIVARDGVVLRNDQEQDRMAGKNLIAAFPALEKAFAGGYTE